MKKNSIYPMIVGVILLSWTVYMTVAGQWGLFREYWGLSLTMLFGSFIAGATPQGGAAVAFPVFTKVFQMPSADARTFGLMIQSVGMTIAALTIWLRGVKILPRVLLWAVLGGTAGMVLGTYFVQIPAPYPKILFTLMLTAFGIAMIVTRWVIRWDCCDAMPYWNHSTRATFLAIGVIGGIFAAYTGAGADALTFVVLTLAFGVDERVSTPTTIMIMAANSLVGFFLHGVVSQDIGVAFNYWLVAIPIVIIGAPLGSWVLSKIGRDTLIVGILVLISAEFISTLILIPFNATMLTVSIVAMLLSLGTFIIMIRYRQHKVLEQEMLVLNS
ncbi:MAG: sulfite exporter TauE/SafE family protein [Candidatus Promineifilaceae bacterium]